MKNSGKTLLLVEDERITARITKRVLEGYGYRMVTANTGEEAVCATAQRDDIDLVLMDIDLGGGIDGAQAARLILEHRDIPIVFLSSHTEPEFVARTERIASYGYVVKTSSNAVLNTSIQMAFRLFDAKKSLKDSELRYSRMISNIADVIVIIDDDGITRYKSPNASCSFGWTPEDVVGKSAFIHVHPDDLDAARKLKIELSAEHGATGTMELRYRCKDGRYVWVEITIANMLHDPFIQGFLGNYRDISVRKQAEQLLRESELRYKALHNASFSGIAIHEHGIILDCNQRLSEITGYSMDELIGMDGLRLFPEGDRQRVRDKIRGGTELPYGAVGIRKNGEEYAVNIRGRNMPYHGRQVRVVEFRDLSDVQKEQMLRRKGERKIRDLLAEKEILLKEVHHRIKNNMYQVYSLLLLQADSVAEQSARQALEEAAQRVQSMMLLYSKIYQSSDFTELPVQEYLTLLIDEILVNFSGSHAIAIEKQIEEFTLDTKQVQALGIIINELLTNSMKHAFVGRSSGKIEIFAGMQDSTVVLKIQDTGVGVPRGFQLETRTGFGLMVVQDLVKQLRGEIRITREKNGTLCALQFKR